MGDKENYIQLVKQARSGDEDSMSSLAERVREPLCIYVHRLTLDNDLTQDILQESLLEMFKFLDKLEKANRFWPWLLRIATNKVHDHYKQEQRQRRASKLKMFETGPKDKQEGLENLIGRELKQVVSAAMSALKPQYRTVLTLRCYEEMAYSEISDVMGCSKFGARMLFVRAKKALVRQLSRRGFGKGSLLLALALFGKMTATSEAAAANITITAATVKVGVAASLVAMAISKTAVITLTTGAVVAAGTLAMAPGTNNNGTGHRTSKAASSSGMPLQTKTNKGIEECWFYYPPNGNGAVMMRLKSNPNGKQQSYSQWLQNDQANYYKQNGTIYIKNHRMWASDLSVQRLPTDSPQFGEFISVVEGKSEKMKYVPQSADGLLVVVKQDQNSSHSQITHRRDISDEEYYRYSWPAEAKVVDNRDAMHKRGWTYFKITGQINGKEVRGRGRIPFVYAVSYRHWPWVELEVADSIINEACFAGLGRPWMGLHTIDTVRRDAAEKRIWFETKYNKRSGKVEVVLKPEDEQIVYTIDMEKDVIERITFSTSGSSQGELRFSYMQEIEQETAEFVAPKPKTSGRPKQDRTGILWLLRLAENNSAVN